MKKAELKQMVGRLIRYLANTLLAISILVFLSGLFVNGFGVYSDLLLWVQINSMWTVVIMLILVENYYLKPEQKVKPKK